MSDTSVEFKGIQQMMSRKTSRPVGPNNPKLIKKPTTKL